MNGISGLWILIVTIMGPHHHLETMATIRGFTSEQACRDAGLLLVKDIQSQAGKESKMTCIPQSNYLQVNDNGNH